MVWTSLELYLYTAISSSTTTSASSIVTKNVIDSVDVVSRPLLLEKQTDYKAMIWASLTHDEYCKQPDVRRPSKPIYTRVEAALPPHQPLRLLPKPEWTLSMFFPAPALLKR
jgi:hypothetical protein